MSVQTKAIKAVKKAAKSKTPSSKTPAKKKLAKPTEPQAANTGATADASVVRVHKYSEVELKALPQTHCLSLIAKRWRREQRKLAKQN